jgi:hypothetical protein
MEMQDLTQYAQTPLTMSCCTYQVYSTALLALDDEEFDDEYLFTSDDDRDTQ